MNIQTSETSTEIMEAIPLYGSIPIELQSIYEAIDKCKERYGYTPEEDDMIIIAQPGEEDYERYRETRLVGNPKTAKVMLCREGYGEYYDSVDAAVIDIPNYFSVI